MGAIFPFPNFSGAIVSESAAYAANNGDIVLVTTGSSTIAVTLPSMLTNEDGSAASSGGFVIVRKVDSGTGAIKVVTADGTTIDGVAGATGRTLSATQYTGAAFASDASGNWYQIAS